MDIFMWTCDILYIHTCGCVYRYRDHVYMLHVHVQIYLRGHVISYIHTYIWK